MPRKAKEVRAVPARCACRWRHDDELRQDHWLPCEEHKAAHEAWEAQEPCPECHQRPGFDPKTGINVRFWDAAAREFVDGHRAGCKLIQVA